MDPSRLIRHRVLSHSWYLVKGCHDCSSCHRHSCSLSPWVSRAAFALRLDGVCMYGWECVHAQARCTSNTAYSKTQECKQLNTSKLGAASKEVVSLHVSQLWSKMILISLWSGKMFLMNPWSDGHVFAVDEHVDEYCAVPFASCPKKLSGKPEEKVLLMYALARDWCFSPLAWASIDFITTLFTPWLCTSWGLGVRSAKRAILIAYWNSQLWWMDTC